MKHPVLAAVLSMLLFTLLGASCDPFVQLAASHYYTEYFERTHLRFRQIDLCRFEVLDELPDEPGKLWLWSGGTSRGLFVTGFPGANIRYDAGSRILEDLDCKPDAGLRPPYDVTYETSSYSGYTLPVDGPFEPFVY